MKHAVLYVDSPACTEAKIASTPMDAFDLFAVEGSAREEVFPNHKETTECQAACIERGVERALVGNIMDYKYYNTSQDFHSWMTTCRSAELCFVNYYDRDRPIQNYWVGFEGELVIHDEIHYGFENLKCFGSFLGHNFVIKDADDNLVADFAVDFTTTIAFGSPPPSGSPEGHSFESEINATLESEWKRHNRVTRSFSPLGFKKGRLPPDVFASMGAFYYNNHRYIINEEWKKKGVFVNWWETDVGLVAIPPGLKLTWQTRLLKLVEAWVGVPIEETLMYGMRQYRSGARLLSHVDRHETHVVSLIANVAQGNLAEPWPVEVFDHQDRLHEITMEPGDIVYYESAKCLHSRNRPLMGRDAFYVNLFTHYKPITTEEWWHQPNHEGAPEPLLEVKGECKLVYKGLSTSGNGGLALVSGTECDDLRLGSFVSPDLYRARNAEDMIQWWKLTSPSTSTIGKEEAGPYKADPTTGDKISSQGNKVHASEQSHDTVEKTSKAEL
mmetsp:Transcript_12345/g.18098  ORF Transcript_12345/g.18098 Transcript_12345/m.18098 type:complete len:499 (-) Transcript_12345:1715-3211(-)